MTYFVVSDVHGFYKELIDALNEKSFFETENKKLIICGDLLDRGKEAVKLVDFCFELKEKGELIYITGNHTDLLVQAMQEIARGGVFEIACGMSPHYSNRTWDTLLQLSEMSEKNAVKHPNELIRKVKSSRFYQELLPSSIDYYETKEYIFCHGWIPTLISGYPPYAKYKYDPQWRQGSPNRWKQARWLCGIDMCCKYHLNKTRKTIVCGHWNASYGHSEYEEKGSEWGKDADFSTFYSDGIIAIDAATAVSGKVNCIVLSDEEEMQK